MVDRAGYEYETWKLTCSLREHALYLGLIAILRHWHERRSSRLWPG